VMRFLLHLPSSFIAFHVEYVVVLGTLHARLGVGSC
jgi:hypothetical protein